MKYTKKDFNNSTILISGGAGFIGSNLAFYFQENYPLCKVVIFDCFRYEQYLDNGNLASFGHYKNLIGFSGEIICGDIKSNEDLSMLDKYNFDYIFHQAAISDTRAYDQKIIMQTNVNSFYYFLDKAKNDDAVIVYASSAAVYGNLPSPQKIGIENPDNPYGYSKFSMDQIANQFSKENKNMKIIGLRFFNVYGPREFYKAKTSSMVIQLGHQILNGKSPRLFTDSKNIFRDFIFIDDVIQANIKACNAKENGTYNVGTGVPRSFQDIAEILKKELNSNSETEYFSNPYEGYQSHTQADISLTVKNMDYKPRFSLEDGIKSYIPEIVRLHNSDIA